MDTGELMEAVRTHHAVEVLYAARGELRTRVVHPHAVYRTAKGKLCLEGVQVEGDTQSGPLPGWRELELMRITEMRVLASEFQPAPEYDRSSAKYRHGLLASA